MSEQKLLDQFDISLGEEVLNDVRASGKSFKKEIWESGIGGGLLGCIFLDKSEHDVLRVQVKVFNSGESSKTNVPQAAQTDHTGALQQPGPSTQESASQAVQVMREKPQQTEVGQQEHQFSQTETNKQAENSSQTPMARLQESTMQTDAKQMAEKLSQTKHKQYNEMTSQTEPPQTQQRAMQVEPAVGVGIRSQTDPTPLSHSEAQTDPKPVRDGVSQTDPKPLVSKEVSAVCTMQDNVMQTIYMGTEKEVQAQPSLSEANIQTDIKTFRSIDIQAKPEIKDRNLQTSREFLRDVECLTEPMIVIDPEDQCEMDCQTDPMRVIDPQLDRDIQVQTDEVKVIYPQNMQDNVAETDFVRCFDPLLEVENSVQTDDVHIRNEECQVEIEVQTEDVNVTEIKELAEADTQTTLVWVCGLQQREEEGGVMLSPSAKVAQEVEIPPEMTPDMGMGDMPDSQDTPSNSQPFPTPDKHELIGDGDMAIMENDKYCQTDPVTIIIGDSSFLVNRLKDYASPPRGMGGRPRGPRRRGGMGSRGGPVTRGGGAMTRGGHTSRPTEEEQPPQLTPEGSLQRDEQQDMPVLPEERKPVPPPRAPSQYHGVRHRQLERADLIPASKSGRFNCPYCNLTFNESALLYRHLQLTHGTPRASNRRARRRGTIILLEDGRKVVENGNPRRQSTGRRRGRKSSHGIPRDDEELYDETEKYTVIQDPDYSEEPMPGEDSYDGSEELVETHKDIGEEGEVTTVHIQQGEDGEVTTVQVLEGELTEGQVIMHAEVHEEGEVVIPNEQEVVTQVTEVANGPQVPVTIPQEDPSRRAFRCPFCPKHFTKSSALYVHLQNSHKGEKQRMRIPRGSRIKYPATQHELYEEQEAQEAEEGEVEPGEVEPGEVEPGEVEPGEVEPGEVESGEVEEEVEPGEVDPSELEEQEEEPGEVEPGEVEPGEVVLAQGKADESEDEWPEREAELKEEKVKLESDDSPRRGRGRPPKRKATEEDRSVSPKRTRKSVETAESRRSSLRRK